MNENIFVYGIVNPTYIKWC